MPPFSSATGPEVMLASREEDDPARVIDRLIRDGWWFELKFDGIRAVLQRTDTGEIRIFNRRQILITYRYPDVVALAQAQLGDWVGVLDGEIVVPGEFGRPDFAAVHMRDAQQSQHKAAASAVKHPASFVPFDILWDGPKDVRGLPYEQRQQRLSDAWGTSHSLASRDGQTMWEFVQEQHLEGLVAKRPGSAYRAGRQKAWVKIKSTHRISALVCGVQQGKGSRGAVGALKLCLWDPTSKAMVDIGAVGSGLRASDLRWLEQNIVPGGDLVVVEVEYLEVSPTGQLRMPVFRGVRADVDPATCLVSTLP